APHLARRHQAPAPLLRQARSVRRRAPLRRDGIARKPARASVAGFLSLQHRRSPPSSCPCFAGAASAASFSGLARKNQKLAAETAPTRSGQAAGSTPRPDPPHGDSP